MFEIFNLRIKVNFKYCEELEAQMQELIITKNDRLIYKLARIDRITKKRRTRSSAKELITMNPDFDRPLSELTEYM